MATIPDIIVNVHSCDWHESPPVPGRYILSKYFASDPEDDFSGKHDATELVDIVFTADGPAISQYTGGPRNLKPSNVYTRRFFGPISPDPRVVDGKLTEVG
jgi:hypothetical protein